MSALAGRTVFIHHFLYYQLGGFDRCKLRNPIAVEVIAQRQGHIYGLDTRTHEVYTFELEDVETATLLDHQDGQLAETCN